MTSAKPPGAVIAAQLAHRRGVVSDVLEHVRADDRVEGIVGQRERRDVEAQVRRPGWGRGRS